MFTVHRAERSQAACSGSSEAQIIGAIGPSRARRTSLIRIAEGAAVELVAAAGAARRGDEAGVPEARDELLQVGARQVLVRGDLGEAGGPGPVAPPELDHQAHAVLALRGEGDGAGSVVARAGASGLGSSGEAGGSPGGRPRHRTAFGSTSDGCRVPRRGNPTTFVGYESRPVLPRRQRGPSSGAEWPWSSGAAAPRIAPAPGWIEAMEFRVLGQVEAPTAARGVRSPRAASLRCSPCSSSTRTGCCPPTGSSTSCGATIRPRAGAKTVGFHVSQAARRARRRPRTRGSGRQRAGDWRRRCLTARRWLPAARGPGPARCRALRAPGGRGTGAPGCRPCGGPRPARRPPWPNGADRPTPRSPTSRSPGRDRPARGTAPARDRGRLRRSARARAPRRGHRPARAPMSTPTRCASTHGRA